MRTNVNLENKLVMLSQMVNDSKFQVLEYDKLGGVMDAEVALELNIMDKAGVKLRQIRIMLDDSAVQLEEGALSFLKGDINLRNQSSIKKGFTKRLFGSKYADELGNKPVYEGTGEIFLEPSFGHYVLIELEDEEIIVDDGLFYACEDGIEITIKKGISSIPNTFEEVYQTSLKGSGIVVLEVPVPESEIFKCKLFNDTLKIDGNFAMLRTGNIKVETESSDGKEYLNVYSGVGEVWLLPTQSIYDDLKNVESKRIDNNINID